MPESPIGSIIAFGGNRPTRGWEQQTGWLRRRSAPRQYRTRNGSQLYKDLFQAISFAWGGDGDTKFNLPGLQGFFLRGVDAPTEDFKVDPETVNEPVPASAGTTGIRLVLFSCLRQRFQNTE